MIYPDCPISSKSIIQRAVSPALLLIHYCIVDVGCPPEKYVVKLDKGPDCGVTATFGMQIDLLSDLPYIYDNTRSAVAV